MRDTPHGSDCRPSAPRLPSVTAPMDISQSSARVWSQLEGFGKGRPCRASGLWARANPGFGRPYRATHPGLWEGSPLQGFGIVDTSEPRVWSPLQGYAPWALKRVAPLGLQDCGHERTQGLVALTGLRTLGFEKERPAGASGLWARANPGFGRPYRATHPGL